MTEQTIHGYSLEQLKQWQTECWQQTLLPESERKPIQYLSHTGLWLDLPTPYLWYHSLSGLGSPYAKWHRIKPKPKLRPFEWHEVPWDAWYRLKHLAHANEGKITVRAKKHNAVHIQDYGWKTLDNLFEHYEHKLPAEPDEIPWHPCGVEG